MKATQLRYARRRQSSRMNEPLPEESGPLIVTSSATALVLESSGVTRVIDFESRRVRVLDHAEHWCRESSLYATAHDRVAGLYSAVHVIEVMRAGGVSIGETWRAPALYGLTVPEAGELPPLSRVEADDEVRWLASELELASFRPADASLSARELTRWYAHGLHLHPTLAAALVEEGRVPAALRCRSHLPLFDIDEILTLESIAEIELELDALGEGYPPRPPIDDVHALALRRDDGPLPAFRHLDAARELFAAKRDVEAVLAAFAHTLVNADPSGGAELIRSVDARAWRWSAVKRLLHAIDRTISTRGDPVGTRERLAIFAKVRKHAGAYAYILDVFTGEGLHDIRENDDAYHHLTAALRWDPQLAAAWVSMGRVYATRLAFDVTWDCWERALALCPRHTVVGDIFAHREALLEHHPQMF